MAGRSVNNCLDASYVGLPGSVRSSVGVGNLNTKGNALAADVAFSHGLHLLFGSTNKVTLVYYQILGQKARSFFNLSVFFAIFKDSSRLGDAFALFLVGIIVIITMES